MDLRIGKLAKFARVNIDTVRYYERNGLLAPTMGLASGHRRYGDLELPRLKRVPVTVVRRNARSFRHFRRAKS
jgi:DNA-binding transcriptional MerR regulator